MRDAAVLRDAGRLPMLRSGDLGDRRRRAEVLDEARASRRPARGRRASAQRRQRVQRGEVDRARARRGARCRPALASSVAATSVSRLRRPSSGSEYLLAMISPCSVMRSPPVDAARRLREDRVEARSAAASDRAAAAVEEPQRDAVRAATADERCSARGRAPSSTRGSRRPCCCPSSRASPPGAAAARDPGAIQRERERRAPASPPPRSRSSIVSNSGTMSSASALPLQRGRPPSAAPRLRAGRRPTGTWRSRSAGSPRARSAGGSPAAASRIASSARVRSP